MHAGPSVSFGRFEKNEWHPTTSLPRAPLELGLVVVTSTPGPPGRSPML